MSETEEEEVSEGGGSRKGGNCVVRGRKGSHVVGVISGVAGGKGIRVVGREGCGVGVERRILGGKSGAAKEDVVAQE